MATGRAARRCLLPLCVLCVALCSPVEGHVDKKVQPGESSGEIVQADQLVVRALPGLTSSLMMPFTTVLKVVKLSKVRYNRAEGIFLGVSPPQLRLADFELSGYVGYGFESYRWRYEIGLKRSWFWTNTLEFGVAHYDVTDTMDRWIVSGLENSLAALLFREDFMDYFRRKGWRFHASQRISETYVLGLELRTDRYETMKKRTDWSIFGGDKEFRLNPPVVQGRMESIVATAQIDLMGYRKGWTFQGEYEKAGDPFGGDYDFHRIWLQGKRYQPTIGNQRAVIHLMAGLHRGTLPEQKRFDVGGIESLRGYPFKAFTGNRMLLGNVYYLFGGDLLGRTGIPVVKSLQLILFSDTGVAFDQFHGLQLRDLKTDIGVALADMENTLRINLAKRLDRGGEPIEITVRLLRKY